MIDQSQMDDLLKFLPLFDVPDRSFFQWGEPQKAQGRITLSGLRYDEDVEEFFRLAHQPWWVDYAYLEKRAGEWLNDPEKIAVADLEQIETVLTYCARGERFCDGFWGELLAEGRVVAVLRRLQQIREGMRDAVEGKV